jgi:hypothetical protein
VFLHPIHKGAITSHMAAQMSSLNTVMPHIWHDAFNSQLNHFLTATRSVPDIIQTRFGYDGKQKAWLSRLDPQEQHRRQEFKDKFSAHFTVFNRLPLSDQRRQTIHGSGLADWHVEVKGLRGVYFGDNMTPLDQTEPPLPSSGDPALDVPMMMSHSLPIQPLGKDFWFGPIGDLNKRSFFPECQGYLSAARNLVTEARTLFANIHQGHPLTPPQW